MNMDSNTTNVKVKRSQADPNGLLNDNSNTTNVKVKRCQNRSIEPI